MKNQNGFILSSAIITFSNWFFRLLIALLIGLLLSLHDITFPSKQEFLNDMTYLFNILHI
jgi:hypothetical protein